MPFTGPIDTIDVFVDGSIYAFKFDNYLVYGMYILNELDSRTITTGYKNFCFKVKNLLNLTNITNDKFKPQYYTAISFEKTSCENDTCNGIYEGILSIRNLISIDGLNTNKNLQFTLDVTTDNYISNLTECEVIIKTDTKSIKYDNQYIDISADIDNFENCRKNKISQKSLEKSSKINTSYINIGQSQWSSLKQNPTKLVKPSLLNNSTKKLIPIEDRQDLNKLSRELYEVKLNPERSKSIERFKDLVTKYNNETRKTVSGLPTNWDSILSRFKTLTQTAGAKKQPTKTNQKVKTPKGDRIVYKGPRGGKYVKLNNKLVNIKNL